MTGARHDARGTTPLKRAFIPKDGAIVACVGSAGMGKTVTVGRIAIREVRKHGRRLIAFDPTGDVHKRVTEPVGGGARIRPEECAKVGSAAAARLAFANPDIRAVFLTLEAGVIEPLIEAFLELASDKGAIGFVLVADEAHLVFPLGISAKSKALAVATLVRNRRQLLLWTTQRPQNCSVSLRQNSKLVFVFRADSARFVDPGCGEFGFVELFVAANTLRRFEYLFRSEPGDHDVTVRKGHALNDAIPF